MKPAISLAKAGVGNFQRGRSRLIEVAWIVIECIIIDNRLNVFSGLRVALLRAFGARIGKGCRFLHAIQVKFPWKLEVGDNCWIGDGVVFYNHDRITIGNDVCISQGSFFATGSHEFASTMDLKVAPIVIEDGVWISSRCLVQMGVRIGRNALVTPNSVVHKDLPPDWIYGGNPCRAIRDRWTRITSSPKNAVLGK